MYTGGTSTDSSATQRDSEHVFLGMKRVGWDAQATISEFLRRYPPDISEWSFTNVLVWLETYPRNWMVACDHLICGYHPAGTTRWICLQPVGPDPARAIRTISKPAAVLWHRVDARIGEAVRDSMHVVRTLDESDYVYNRHSLLALEGPEYRQIRRHVSHGRRHNAEIRLFDAGQVEACKIVVQKWLRSKGAGLCPIQERDAKTALHMLECSSGLPLIGVVAYVENQPEAFVIGEQLANGVCVSHFEKANLEFRGLAHFTFHEWAQRLPESCSYINREQAQGDEGLIVAKELWCPCWKVEKCEIEAAS